MDIAKESQNQIQFDTYTKKGGIKLGPYSSHIWRTDPKHLSFLLARYKFCAKMLQGKKKVLEIGCGDSLGSSIVLQTVNSIHAIDFEPIVIKDAIERNEQPEKCTYQVLDITEQSLDTKFDAAFSLDVIEHVPQNIEDKFIKNISASLKKDGILIIGTPNITTTKYASPGSQEGHINLKSAITLKSLIEKYFQNVFIFSMNDEIVHTGFYPMANYLIGMGVGLK